MRKLALFLFLLLAAPVTAVAEDERLFWGVMLGSTDYDVENGEQIFVGSLNGRVGWDLFPWMAFEGRVLFSDSNTKNNINDFKVAYMGSVLAKFSLPPNRTAPARFYVLGGYSSGRLEFEVASQDTHFSADGISYGLGVEIFANETHGLNIEWLRLVDGEENNQDYTINQIGIGYIHRF